MARAELLRRTDGLAEKVRRVYARPPREASADVDASLYDGFVPDADRRLLPRVRSTLPAQLADAGFTFTDRRFAELLFRYRARNWPETLDAGERERWDDYRRDRLTRDAGLSEYSFETYRAEIAALRAANPTDPRVQTLMDALEDWGRELETSL